jgi:hypothetical protein
VLNSGGFGALTERYIHQIEEYLAGDTTKHFDSIEFHTIMTYYYRHSDLSRG